MRKLIREAASLPGTMNQLAKRLLYWSPRVLGFLFAAFLSVFALDVFSEGYGAIETLLALVMHLIPAALVLMIVWVSWQHEWIAATVFPALGVYYLVSAPGQHWLSYVTISGTLILTGVLFLISLVVRRRESHPA